MHDLSERSEEDAGSKDCREFFQQCYLKPLCCLEYFTARSDQDWLRFPHHATSRQAVEVDAAMAVGFCSNSTGDFVKRERGASVAARGATNGPLWSDDRSAARWVRQFVEEARQSTGGIRGIDSTFFVSDFLAPRFSFGPAQNPESISPMEQASRDTMSQVLASCWYIHSFTAVGHRSHSPINHAGSGPGPGHRYWLYRVSDGATKKKRKKSTTTPHAFHTPGPAPPPQHNLWLILVPSTTHRQLLLFRTYFFC